MMLYIVTEGYAYKLGSEWHKLTWFEVSTMLKGPKRNSLEPDYVKATSQNLPKLGASAVADFLRTSDEFVSAEFRCKKMERWVGTYKYLTYILCILAIYNSIPVYFNRKVRNRTLLYFTYLIVKYGMDPHIWDNQLHKLIYNISIATTVRHQLLPNP